MDDHKSDDTGTEGQRERVYETLLHSLRVGRFTPGQKLTIRSLAKECGTSPTPVRESLQRLAAEGFLEMEQNRSARVPKLTGQQIRELREIRIALEGLAVSHVVDHADEQLIDRLRALQLRIIEARRAEDFEADVQLVYEFQFALYEASEMPQLVDLIRNIWLRTSPYLRYLYPDYIASAHSWREPLIAALEAKDAEGARTEIERDISSVLNYTASLADAAARLAK